MIVEMKKLKLIGMSNEKEAILDSLHSCNCVELKDADKIDRTHKRLNVKRQSETISKLARLNFAISFIDKEIAERIKLAGEKIVDFEKPKKPFMAAREDTPYEEFLGSTKSEYEMYAVIESLQNFSDKLAEIKSEELKLNNLINGLKIYKSLDIAFNEFKDSKYSAKFLGTIAVTNDDVIEKIKAQVNCEIEIFEKGSALFGIFATCHKEDKARLNDLLASLSFAKCPYDFDDTASNKIAISEGEIEQLKSQAIEINGEVVSLKNNLPKLKLLYDYYSYKLEKIEAQGGFNRTEKELAFMLEAWVPSDLCEFVEKRVLSKSNTVVLDFSKPDKEDPVPTLTRNKKLIAPYESVTNMYSVPSYGENDPNIFVAIFFFIFFGFMLSDAGYGLILVAASLLLVKFVKLEKGTKNLALIIAMGGVSTIIWGALFGGWFAIDITGTFLENFVLFIPLEEPLAILGLALGLGVVQILFALGLKAYRMIKDGRPFDALMDVGSWYLLFIGLGMIGGSLVPGLAFLSNVGMYVSLAGVAALILTQGRSQKGILMKTFKGIGSLYGLMGFLSDILSYARLFGLGLATGVVGMVFNKLAGVFFSMLGPIVGSVVAVAVLLAGHTLNIGINVLGAYVHNCRLQYIEFFSRFYEGGGHAFKPLGTSTKYIKVI